MTLHLSNNNLTCYVKRSGYAVAETIPLEGTLSGIASNLLGWLAQQLLPQESLTDVVLEASGQVTVAFETSIDEEGNEIEVPTDFRLIISAAVSVQAPLGSRTFVATSEQLPEELRDGLLQAWTVINNT
jgi:hypothetical protein